MDLSAIQAMQHAAHLARSLRQGVDAAGVGRSEAQPITLDERQVLRFLGRLAINDPTASIAQISAGAWSRGGRLQLTATAGLVRSLVRRGLAGTDGQSYWIAPAGRVALDMMDGE